MAKASWWLYTETPPEVEGRALWFTVTTPGAGDDWHREIPIDGRPTPFFPVTLDFGKISSGRSARNEFQANHVGFWINHVPLFGIPLRDDPLRQSFLDWIAMDYVSGTVERGVKGCLVVDGKVVISLFGNSDDCYAAIEIVNPYTCILHGYVWGWDFEHRLFDGELERGNTHALFPLENVEKW